MTVHDLVGLVFIALLFLDCGLWLFYFRASRNTNLRKVMLQVSLGVFIGLIVVFVVDQKMADVWHAQIPDDVLVPVMIGLVALHTFATGTLMFALIAVIQSLFTMIRSKIGRDSD